MKFRSAIAGVLSLFAAGCGSNSSTTVPHSAVRMYNGTASVGDFLTLSLDSNTHTLTYANHSNGDHGVIPYTVNSDGTYALHDPGGNLLAAYEIPNYALLLQAAKTGPTHDIKALVTAVQSGPLTIRTLEGHSYNYMQFRTTSGGIEAGSISVDAQGNVSHESYTPSGAQDQPPSSFNSGGFVASTFQEDASGSFLVHDDGQGSVDYVFGTQNGIFAVDNSNGGILGLLKAAGKDFDPLFAGTYKAIFYEKTGAASGPNNTETGTPILGKATLVVGASGQTSLQDEQNNVLAQGTLAAVADTPYLFGSAGELSDPCFGLFTFRVTSASSQQDIFLTFQGRAVLFSSFRANLSAGPSKIYDYFYGVALK
jgi:hypothetical protein